jgi:hypothetical protein
MFCLILSRAVKMSVLTVCFNVFGDQQRVRRAVYIMSTFCTVQSIAAVIVSV